MLLGLAIPSTQTLSVVPLLDIAKYVQLFGCNGVTNVYIIFVTVAPLSVTSNRLPLLVMIIPKQPEAKESEPSIGAFKVVFEVLNQNSTEKSANPPVNPGLISKYPFETLIEPGPTGVDVGVCVGVLVGVAVFVGVTVFVGVILGVGVFVGV